MRQDLTYLTLVIDRSGSMKSIAEEAKGGLNAMILDQAKQPGDCILNVVQFDDQIETVVDSKNARDIKEPIDLVPRGMTRLCDAVGISIIELGKELSALSEDQRPATVLFAIITDGHENSSKEYLRHTIAAMIKEQTDKYGWKFTYIGANQNAFDEAESLGIARSSAMNFSPTGGTARRSYQNLNAAVNHARTSGIKGQSVGLNYSDEDRAAALTPDQAHLAVDSKKSV